MDAHRPPSPRSRPRVRRFAAPAVLVAAVGCTASNPLAQRHTMIGTLKASVSQLESEKAQLQRQVAELRTENRRMEDRLAEEQATNEDLADRLEGARGLLGRQGGESDFASAPDAAAPPTSRAIPARRTPSKSRKPPFARIPGEIKEIPEPRDDLEGETGEFDPHLRREPSDAQSRHDRSPWLPVARGLGGSGKVR